MRARRTVAVLTLAGLLAGCSVATSPSSGPQPQPTGRTSSTRTPNPRPIDGQIAERLQRVMVPLIRAMNNPLPLNQVKVGVIDDPRINAASAGNGEFYVTRGLLEKA